MVRNSNGFNLKLLVDRFSLSIVGSILTSVELMLAGLQHVTKQSHVPTFKLLLFR